MIGLLIEIIGFQQISKLEPDITDGLIKRISGILKLDCQDIVNGNCIYYQFEYDSENGRKTWEMVNELYNCLLDAKDDFHGFLILADRLNRCSVEEGFGRVRKKSYFIKETNALVITPRAEDYCEGFFDVERRNGNLVLSSRPKWKPLQGDEYDSFYYRKRLVDRIAGRLIGNIEDGPAYSVLHFYGNNGIGKNYNIKRSILKIREKSGRIPLPVITGTGGLKAAFQEIIESLDPDFISRVPELLSGPEKESWKSRKFLLEQGASDHVPHDIFIFYRLYIQAYIRLAEEQIQPAFIICRDPDLISEESLELLSKIMKEFLSDGNLVPVAVTEKNTLPKIMSEFPSQRIRITPLSLMEVEERLSNAGFKEADTNEIRERTEGHVIFLSHYIMLRQKGVKMGPEIKGKEISRLLLKKLELRLQTVLYAVSIFPGMTDAAHWVRILEDNDIIQSRAENSLEELKGFGFIGEDQWLRPVIEGIEKEVLLTPEDMKEVEYKIARTDSSIWSEQKVFSVYSFLQGLKTREAVKGFGRYFFDYTSLLLEQGQIRKGEALIEVYENLNDINRDSLTDTVIQTLALRASLMRGDQETSRVRFLALTDITENPLSLEEALNNLEAARYLYASGEYRDGLDAAKKSLLYLQNEDNRLLRSDANCQIGMIMMGMERLDEAAMYFQLGREQLNPEDDPHNYIKTMVLEGLCRFISGNLSQVKNIMEEAGGMAAAFGRREWELYTVFLLGRTEFELGRYESAGEKFVAGLLMCRLYFSEEKTKVFYAWIARCRIYLKHYDTGLHILGGLKPDIEVLFITSEALFFSGREKMSLEALQLALDGDFKGQSFCPGEYISWISGYASVEDRAFRSREGTGVLNHLVRAFRGYIRGRGFDKEEGRQELSRLTRDEKLGEEDPYNHLYYYFYNEIVPELGDTEIVNKLTILSRSLKYLQQRASRVYETEDKKDYMYRNYWNSLIMNEGREQKIL